MNDMDSSVDERLRDAIGAVAVGIEPSARAWSEIEGRLGDAPHRRKPTTWRVAILGLACVALAVSVTAALLLTRDDAPSKRRAAHPREPSVVWQRQFASPVTPSFRRSVVLDRSTVFVSEGYAEPSAVRALDRGTGATRWSRTFPSAVFIQGSASGVVIVGGYDALAGLDVATGAVRWTVDLPGEGLGGYEPVVSSVRSETSAIGLSADSEGDVRPPVVLGLNPVSGKIRWRTPLADGTDLTFAQPLVANDAAVFLTTLSHPGSAPGSGAYAVDIGDGSIQWDVPLGGNQGFGAASAVATPGAVHIPSQLGILTVASSDGTIEWRFPGTGAAAVAHVGDALVALDGGAIVTLDSSDGREIARTATSVTGPQLLDSLSGGRGLLVLGLSSAQGIDLGRNHPLWSITWPGRLATIPVESGGMLISSTMDGRITAFRIPQT